jgi:outer membrane protein assembly factor BamB
MSRVVLASSLTLALTLTLATAADWPQFLGPNRDNATAEKVEPWKAPPKVLWKKPVGDAHSSPVVADGVVYAFYSPKGKNADALAAFDAKTGDLKWEKSYARPEFKPPFGAGPRGTPTVAGGKVYTLGGTGVLTCWDAKTGDTAWSVDTLKEFGAKNLFFGISTSPQVVDDKVVVMVGGKGAGIVAFDKATGKPVWKATDDGASYASAIDTGTGADRQLVFLTGSHLRGLSVDGKELWSFPFQAKVGFLIESSTTPVRVGDYVVGGSVTDGSVALKVGHADGKWTATKAWLNPALTCYFSTPVAAGKHLYMVNGTASLRNPTIALRCVELETGKVAWERPKVGKYHAALVRTANDKLLMLDDNGDLVLFAADPAAYKELARAKVCGPTWAHPAVSDGRVYVRDDKELICVGLGE